MMLILFVKIVKKIVEIVLVNNVLIWVFLSRNVILVIVNSVVIIVR